MGQDEKEINHILNSWGMEKNQGLIKFVTLLCESLFSECAAKEDYEQLEVNRFSHVVMNDLKQIRRR